MPKPKAWLMPFWTKKLPPRQVTTLCPLPAQPIADAVASVPRYASIARLKAQVDRTGVAGIGRAVVVDAVVVGAGTVVGAAACECDEHADATNATASSIALY